MIDAMLTVGALGVAAGLWLRARRRRLRAVGGGERGIERRSVTSLRRVFPDWEEEEGCDFCVTDGEVGEALLRIEYVEDGLCFFVQICSDHIERALAGAGPFVHEELLSRPGRWS